jgi:acyl dehydratase
MAIVISSFSEFEEWTGREIGVSAFHRITQEQINQFASATLDHQWIHTDPERARTESPFQTTIAHGYLTLSLVPYFWSQIAEMRNIKMLVNYGIEDLKFNQPVREGDEVRLRVSLRSLVNLRGIVKATMHVTLEIKDCKKPAFTADIVLLYHFH